MGSNTVHLLLVDAHHGGAPVPAHSHKTELRLAENLTSDGRVSDRAIRALTGFVSESIVIAEDMGANEILGFATSAIRDAPNGAEVIAAVEQETGVRLSLLSGEASISVWNGSGGADRYGLDVTAHGVLTAYHIGRKRKASAGDESTDE